MSKLNISHPQYSFKRQFIKFISDRMKVGDTSEIIGRSQELGIAGWSISHHQFDNELASISVELYDGSSIVISQREIDEYDMKENKRKIIESNVYARMLNDAIESVKRGDINETIATMEARFNNQLKKEQNKC